MVAKIYVMFVFVFVDFNLGKTEGKRGEPRNLVFLDLFLFTLLLEEMFAYERNLIHRKNMGRELQKMIYFLDLKRKRVKVKEKQP